MGREDPTPREGPVMTSSRVQRSPDRYGGWRGVGMGRGAHSGYVRSVWYVGGDKNSFLQASFHDALILVCTLQL